MAVAYFFNTAEHTYEVNTRLVSDARLVVEKLCWGVRPTLQQADRRGIAEAVSAVVSTSQIDYTDIAGTARSIRENDGNVEYREGTSGAWTVWLNPSGGFPFDPALYSTQLRFSQTHPRAVTVNLVLGRKIKGKWYYASVSTQVFFRNS